MANREERLEELQALRQAAINCIRANERERGEIRQRIDALKARIKVCNREEQLARQRANAYSREIGSLIWGVPVQKGGRAA